METSRGPLQKKVYSNLNLECYLAKTKVLPMHHTRLPQEKMPSKKQTFQSRGCQATREDVTAQDAQQGCPATRENVKPGMPSISRGYPSTIT